MKRCKRCIMPETVPGITFDEDGICSFCLDYKQERCLDKEGLDRIIASIKKRDNKYDCVVPLSGGRDSSFVLYTAKATYNLKVLAVNYDNEFRTDQALTNMKKACEALDVDFVSVRSKRDVAQKIVLYGIRSALPFGLRAVSGGLCQACAYGYTSVVYRAAEKHEVPLILWGESRAEATQGMEKKATQDMREREAERLKKSRFLRLFNASCYKVRYYKTLQRVEFHVPGNGILPTSRPILKNEDIKEIRLFDYVPWDRKNIKETITRELSWEKPRGHISSWRIDCMLHLLMNYCFFSLLGCSKDCFGYCRMINSGQMDRTEALKQEEEMAATFTENMPELLISKIGLSEKEVARILSPG
jgi:N-acetyl sugar amidotransferase